MNMVSELLKEKETVQHYLGLAKSPLAACSFASIFCWQDFFDFEFQRIDDHLCIFARNEIGCFLYLPPLGQGMSRAVIDQCFERMQEVNRGSSVTRIENVSESQLSFFPADDFVIYHKSNDYCYAKDDLMNLRGNRYKSKRSALNQFQARYRARYLPYDASMATECLALYDQWAENRRASYADDVYQQMITDNRQVHQLIFRYFREMDLVGRVVEVNGRIKGYTFGHPVTENIFCVFCEVTDLTIKGLAVYIFHQFCQDVALKEFSWINVMDDFGMDNIQKTKMSFRPAQLIASYVVTKGTDTKKS